MPGSSLRVVSSPESERGFTDGGGSHGVIAQGVLSGGTSCPTLKIKVMGHLFSRYLFFAFLGWSLSFFCGP